MVTNLRLKMKRTTTDEKKDERLTAVLQKRGCCASYDSFVYNCSAVLRMNGSAKKPRLRKAAKRLLQEK